VKGHVLDASCKEGAAHGFKLGKVLAVDYPSLASLILSRKNFDSERHLRSRMLDDSSPLNVEALQSVFKAGSLIATQETAAQLANLPCKRLPGGCFIICELKGMRPVEVASKDAITNCVG
jgi:hypothetical protein